MNSKELDIVERELKTFLDSCKIDYALTSDVNLLFIKRENLEFLGDSITLNYNYNKQLISIIATCKDYSISNVLYCAMREIRTAISCIELLR